MSSYTELIRVLFDAEGLGYDSVSISKDEGIEFMALGKKSLFIDDHYFVDIIYHETDIQFNTYYSIEEVIKALDFDYEDLAERDAKYWEKNKKVIRRKVVDLDAIPNPQRTSVLTLNGLVFINEDDWLVKGVNGELYPCSRKVFDQLYEVVEE